MAFYSSKDASRRPLYWQSLKMYVTSCFSHKLETELQRTRYFELVWFCSAWCMFATSLIMFVCFTLFVCLESPAICHVNIFVLWAVCIVIPVGNSLWCNWYRYIIFHNRSNAVFCVTLLISLRLVRLYLSLFFFVLLHVVLPLYGEIKIFVMCSFEGGGNIAFIGLQSAVGAEY